MSNNLFKDIDRQLKKVKKANGEIIGVNVVCIFRRFPLQPPRGRRNGIADFRTLLSCPYFHFRHGICFEHDLDSRKETAQSQELWHLAPI